VHSASLAKTQKHFKEKRLNFALSNHLALETNRQKKVANIFQEELAEIFRKVSRESFQGTLLTVTSVWVSPDLSVSKVYLSIFPNKNQKEIIEKIKEKAPYYRSLMAKTAAKNMRTTPEFLFYLDTTLEDTEKIEKALRGEGNNPIL
jgi:ribosome-binding factor A